MYVKHVGSAFQSENYGDWHMPKLIKTCCVAAFAGTTLFMSINVLKTKASLVDDLYNRCVAAYNLGQLNNQGLAYCDKVDELKQQTDGQSRIINNIYPNPGLIYPNTDLMNQNTHMIRNGSDSLGCALETSCAPALQYPYAYPTNLGF